MTPLAAYLTKQIVARPKHRDAFWRTPENLKSLREALDDIHCFEVSACVPLASDFVARRLQHRAEVGNYAFLPAPKTWLEFRGWDGEWRFGLWLEQETDIENQAKCMFFTREGATNVGVISTTSFAYAPYDGDDQYYPRVITEALGDDNKDPSPAILLLTHIMLVLINSPKIIGRRQHMPNAGLERNLTRGFGVGKFPLHAWTEILLQVRKPTYIDDGEPHEAHLTGRRALHFCRKHIRIRNGQLEYVSAHWRGDPALGIKRSRYMVTA